jgi:hypothetical protein
VPSLDAAAAVLAYLQSDAAASVVRDILVADAYLKEVGDYIGDDLSEAESLRRTVGDLTKVLGITVQDDGEEPITNQEINRQTIVIRVLDRRRGYTNIREAREAILWVLSAPVRYTLVSGQKGVMQLRFSGRSGYQYSPEFYADYEAIEFVCDAIRKGQE